jgi:hypothetical protein
MAMKPKSDDREMAPEHLSEQQTPQGRKSCTQESGSILAAGRKSPTVTLRIKGPSIRPSPLPVSSRRMNTVRHSRRAEITDAASLQPCRRGSSEPHQICGASGKRSGNARSRATAAGSPLPAHRSNASLVRQNETPRQLFGQTERRRCTIHCRRSRHSMIRTLLVK